MPDTEGLPCKKKVVSSLLDFCLQTHISSENTIAIGIKNIVSHFTLQYLAKDQRAPSNPLERRDGQAILRRHYIWRHGYNTQVPMDIKSP